MRARTSLVVTLPKRGHPPSTRTQENKEDRMFEWIKQLIARVFGEAQKVKDELKEKGIVYKDPQPPVISIPEPND